MDKATDADAGKARWTIVARRTLLGVAILMAANQAALAAPVTLLCTGRTWGPYTLDLNEAARTVTITWPARVDPQVSPPLLIPASSIGPIAAKFDSKTITFANRSSSERRIYESWNLDRRTGALIEYRGVDAPYDRAKLRNAWSLTCHVAKAKF